MTTENKFGKVSRLKIRSEYKDGETIIADMSFTAPYKIMTPFRKPDGGISVMPLCASAGIMNGDCQEFEYRVGENSRLEMLSQSFEKIHKMSEGGSAGRSIQAEVGKNAVFYYYPQPVIPFAESAFDSSMDIRLADESSQLFLTEIITCGRSARGEQFQYRRFSSKVEIYRGGELIYRDNTRFEPEKFDMSDVGMYEGYTHVANIFMTAANGEMREQLKSAVWEILEAESESGSSAAGVGGSQVGGSQVGTDGGSEVSGSAVGGRGGLCEGGVTELAYGDLAVRIFGSRAQSLQQLSEKIKSAFEKQIAEKR